MITYDGYTVEEIHKMEEDGTCPTHILISYINGDSDGSDGEYPN